MKKGTALRLWFPHLPLGSVHHGKKEVVFYPGLDECGVMVMNSLSKGPYFGAGDETRYYIRELCKKYEIYQ